MAHTAHGANCPSCINWTPGSQKMEGIFTLGGGTPETGHSSMTVLLTTTLGLSTKLLSSIDGGTANITQQENDHNRIIFRFSERKVINHQYFEPDQYSEPRPLIFETLPRMFWQSGKISGKMYVRCILVSNKSGRHMNNKI